MVRLKFMQKEELLLSVSATGGPGKPELFPHEQSVASTIGERYLPGILPAHAGNSDLVDMYGNPEVHLINT